MEIVLNDVLLIWQGLGFYNRAINLHKTARIICLKYNGIVPKRYEDLSSLPGVGDYTAKAIMSIAYKKKVIGIDVNIKRVTSRVFGLDSHNIKKINQKLSALIPENRSDDFMQALMDIGAVICQKRKVNCLICPLKINCKFFKNKNKLKNSFSNTKIKKKFLFIFLMKYKNQIILKKRKNTKFLNNLMEIPNILLSKKISLLSAKKQAPIKLNWVSEPEKLFINISNFNLEIRCFTTNLNQKILLKNTKWLSTKNINKVPVSSLMKKILFHLKLI